MHPVTRQVSPHAARLRRDRTDAEDCFWQAVRNRQIDGSKVLRFWNNDVLTNLEGVITVVRSELAERRQQKKTLPNPSREGGRG